MKKTLESILPGQQILVLGYGQEGRSTYRFLKEHLPTKQISIADRSKSLANELRRLEPEAVHLGEEYLDHLEAYDHIIKSPGVPFRVLSSRISRNRITSQTEMFLELRGKQTIGVTGTKGKSTTAALLHQILKQWSDDVFLLGNIGVPPLDCMHRITEASKIVFEMSSHQLDGLQTAPGIAVLLNLFEEHLDHYGSLEEYRKAKYQIFLNQQPEDFLVYNWDDDQIRKDVRRYKLKQQLVPFSMDTSVAEGTRNLGNDRILWTIGSVSTEFDFSNRVSIPGDHNLRNIMAAVNVCKLLQLDDVCIEKSVNAFEGLEHRLEYVGQFRGIHFYNDSIATIPEATLEAVKTLGGVHTLILGGKNRGISYQLLIDFLDQGLVEQLILIGEVGQIIKNELLLKQWDPAVLLVIQSFDELGNAILKTTPKGQICLLSPAASSYDMFQNFEHRGRSFKEIAANL